MIRNILVCSIESSFFSPIKLCAISFFSSSREGSQFQIQIFAKTQPPPVVFGQKTTSWNNALLLASSRATSSSMMSFEICEIFLFFVFHQQSTNHPYHKFPSHFSNILFTSPCHSLRAKYSGVPLPSFWIRQGLIMTSNWTFLAFLRKWHKSFAKGSFEPVGWRCES